MDRGVYVAVKPTQQSIIELNLMTQEYDIPNAIDGSKLHSTIVFSRTYDDISVNKENIYEATIELFRVFKTREGNCGLVIEMDAKDLVNRHMYFMNNYKLTYEFDKFIPHMTLTYNLTAGFDCSKLPVTRKKLCFHGEYVEDLDLEWKKSL
jgi:hypothetical protein